MSQHDNSIPAERRLLFTTNDVLAATSAPMMLVDVFDSPEGDISVTMGDVELGTLPQGRLVQSHSPRLLAQTC